MSKARVITLALAAVLLGSVVSCSSSSTTITTSLSAPKNQDTLKPGDAATFTATVTNHGPGVAQNVTMHVDLPAGFLYKATTEISGDGTRTQPADPAVNSPSPEWGLWSLAAPSVSSGSPSYSSISIKFTVQAGGTPGQYLVIARSAADNATGDASPPTVQVKVAAAAGLSLRVSAQPTSAHDNDTITYKISVNNDGSGNANTLEALATLPAGFVYLKTTQTSGNSARSTTHDPQAHSQLPFWGDYTVPARSDAGPGTLEITFTAQVSRGLASGTYPISVQITDDVGDTVTANEVVPITIS
jgi:uncharacterized repeat protein (TIGR01451 family)